MAADLDYPRTWRINAGNSNYYDFYRVDFYYNDFIMTIFVIMIFFLVNHYNDHNYDNEDGVINVRVHATPAREIMRSNVSSNNIAADPAYQLPQPVKNISIIFIPKIFKTYSNFITILFKNHQNFISISFKFIRISLKISTNFALLLVQKSLTKWLILQVQPCKRHKLSFSFHIYWQYFK